MRTGRAALGALALLLTPALAWGRSGARAGRAAVVTVHLGGGPTNGSETLDVFFLSGDTSTTPRFAVRDATFVDGAPRGVRWADSRTCPAVLERLEAMSRIAVRFSPPYPLDRPRTTGLPRPPTPPPSDGAEVGLEGDGIAEGPEGGSGRMKVAGSTGPWVRWAHDTSRALASCWSGMEPAVSTGG